MKELVDKYIDQCITIGILTPEQIRKYPLRPGNIAVVLKAYSLNSKLPFTLDNNDISIYNNYKLYLTKDGYDWLINEFKKYTLVFLRVTFQHLFVNLKYLKDLENHNGLNNLKGITGINYKQGTLNGALLIQKQGVRMQELYFKTLAEARQEVISLTRFYPIENFILYRMSKSKGVYYKQKVPLILESNRRGMAINLPHLKGKV
jgi:hypothetical protein